MERTKLEILTNKELEEIHAGALHLLETVGVEIFEKEAIDVLTQGGAKVKDKRVCLPEKLVLENLEKVPKSFSIHARGQKHSVTLGSGKTYIEPMIGRINVIDLDTKKKRGTNIKDAGDLIKLADALDNYHILHSGAVMPRVEGVPEGTAHVHGYLQGVKNSTKIIKGSGRGKKVAEDCIQMASILGQCKKEELAAKPNIFTTINVISPLKHDRAQTQGLMTYAKYGLPVEITSEPQMGATSPVTHMGTLIQQTAEILSGIVIVQLINPGNPVIIGTCAAAMDLKNGLIALGGVEGALINIAHAQLAKYYGIPSRGTGCNTDSKVLDIQAGYEKALTLILTVFAGNDIVFYPGTIEHALTIDYRSLLIDNEICGMALRAAKGIEVNDETKAVELIEEIGVKGGHYLGKKHTIDHMEKELFFGNLTNRDTREVWQTKGSKRLDEVAKDRVREILETHKPEPLPDSVQNEMELYIMEVEKRESSKS
jgi:trimethylamine--corrinoid protein Co-methyltransferase